MTGNNALREFAYRPVPELPEPGERIRLRNLFKVSQQQLAEALHVTRRTIHSWESGKSEPTGQNRDNYTQVLTLWAERERELSGK